MTSQCHCPAACNVTAYNADLSYAALSVDGIDALLADDRAEIAAKHVTAKELQQRVKAASMIGMLQKLRRIDETVAEFQQFWESKINRVQTSIVYRIEKALASTVKMANDDIGSLYQNVSHYKAFYYKYLSGDRQWLGELLARADSAMKDGLMQVVSDWDLYSPPVIESSIKSLETALDVLQQAAAHAQYYGGVNGSVVQFKRTHNYSDDLYFPSYAVKDKSNNHYCKLMRALSNAGYDNMPETLPKAIQYVSFPLPYFQNYTYYTSYDELFQIPREEYINSMTTNNHIWRAFYRNVTLCLNEYENYLVTMETWLAANKMSYSSR